MCGFLLYLHLWSKCKEDRVPLWNALSSIADKCNPAWIIMDIEDSIGAHVRLRDIQPIRTCMAYYNLFDLKTVGRQFSRNNKQDGVDRVLSRIERVLSNSAWSDLFPTTEANFLREGSFDQWRI